MIDLFDIMEKVLARRMVEQAGRDLIAELESEGNHEDAAKVRAAMAETFGPPTQQPADVGEDVTR